MLGEGREEGECSGLLTDRTYGEPARLSSFSGDPETQEKMTVTASH